jgi:hypothetical protein
VVYFKVLYQHSPDGSEKTQEILAKTADPIWDFTYWKWWVSEENYRM